MVTSEPAVVVGLRATPSPTASAVRSAVVARASDFALTQELRLARRRAGRRPAGASRALPVAREPSPEDVFAAVAEEVGRLLRVENTLEYRFEADGVATVVAIWGAQDVGVPIGTRVTLQGQQRPPACIGRAAARFDDYTDASGPIAARARGA